MASVKQKLDEKASYQNLRNLEFQLEEYVKQVQFQDLISTITNKAESTDFIIVNQQLNIIQASLQILKHQNEGNSDKIKHLDINLKEQIKLITTNIKEIEEGIKKTTYDTNGKIIQAKEVQRQYIKEQELKDKARLQERDECEFKYNRKFEKINQTIEGLATKDQLVKLKVEILPPIKEQSSRINNFSVDNEQMKEVIRRFDEVISEKASKMSIHELEMQLEKQYVKIKNWNQMQQEVGKSMEMQQENVVKMQDSVKNFEQNMSEEITVAVKKSLTKTMANYEKVLHQFSKFFDQEELNKILERKVDLDYVQSMGDMKANKIDVESCVSLIESVHERIKHIAILQVELAKVLIPVKTTSHFQATETKNSKINRRDFLYRQAQLTSSWIGEFTVRQTYPDEEEHINSIRSYRNDKEQAHNGNGKQVKIMRKNIAFSDVPSPIRAFERYHSQQIQEKTKQDLPQTLKRWKQQLSQKQSNQMKGSNNPYQQMSFTQSNFNNLKQHPSIQLEDFLKERQNLYQNQKLSDQLNQKTVRKNYKSVRVSLNSSPHNQYNHSSNQTINDKGNNSITVSASESINQSQRYIQIGGQDIALEDKQKHYNDQTQDQTFLSTIMNEQSMVKNPSLNNFNYGMEGSLKKMPPLINTQKRVTIFNSNQPNIKVSKRLQEYNIDKPRNMEEQRQMILQNAALITVNQIKVSSRGISYNPKTNSYNPQSQM